MLKNSSSIKMGYREYCAIPDDGRRHEIVDGVHYVNPAPSTYHQTVSRKIQFQLFAQIELKEEGFVFNAPTDLQLSEHDIVQPDILLVLKRHKIKITPTKIKGPPDLVIEIISPGTKDHDRVRKFSLYGQSGVAEYWIVDIDEHRVEQYVLRHGQYQLLGTHTEEIAPDSIEHVRVDLTQVW